ncbi:putative ATP-dependent DNA helicase HFM1, partial [Galemys pyrenaicus]
YPENEKSLDLFLQPAPLISEIPDTQALEEEIESCKLLGQKKRPIMLTSNLKITNEVINSVSPIQKFQLASGTRNYKEDDLNLEREGNNDLPHVTLKLTYGSSQNRNHTGTEIAPEKNISGDLKLVNFIEDKGASTSTFRKRLFKISDSTHGSAFSNDSANLDFHIGSVKTVPTEMNNGSSWKCSNSKQKPQYSDINMFTASDAFFASELGGSIFKAPSFSAIAQPHEVQVAPIKALCSQRFDDWKGKFGPIGLNCKELTGDTVMDDLFEIQHAHIIMTTPVHIIKDENRGPTLEVVVSRMKTVKSLSHTSENTSIIIPMRFVAVSATIPNAEDIAEWLSDGERPAVCLKMDESHRPVKLRKVVLGFPCSSNQTEFKFDLTLNYKIASIIQTYSDQKPTLVFCATRKGVQQASLVLVKDAKFIMTVEQKQRLRKCANSIRDTKLRVTTSTLAMGVNLPAHLVVIKSTMHYAGGMFEEYSETDILQMIGRAGRPQFDTTATAVIMTRLSTREKYIQMLACSDTVESSLHRHLIEHLNAEIVLHTITDVNVALEWIRSTLLYIRALKNPSHYELCLKNLNDLSSLDLIKMDDDVNFKPTEAGRLMAWYYITFETVKKFCTISGKETLLDLVTMIASCKEFLDIQLRTNEKKTLNTLNKDPNRLTIRFPMDGRIKTREMKEKKFAVLLNSLILAKCFRCRLWENSLHVSKQLEKIGITLSNAMVNAGLTSFKKIEDTDARELELIKETVMYLPKYELEVEQIPRYKDTAAEIVVTIILRNFEQLQTKRTAPDSHYVTLIIGDADNQLVFKHKIMDSVLLKAGNWAKKIDVKRALKSEDLSINLISSEYVGLDIQQKFTVYYLGPKRFGNQIIMQKKEAAVISCSKYSDKFSTAGSNKGKIGVAKKSEMQINKSQNVNLKEFGFTPKPSLPSVSRSEYLNTPDLPIMEQKDQHEVHAKVQQQESSEYQHKDVDKSKSPFSEDLNVNFELGNEVWEDFDDENLIEATNFSADAEMIKSSGFGDMLNLSTRGSKLSFQQSKSKFQREIFVSSYEEPDTYLSNSAMSKCSTSSMMKLPQQSGNANIVCFQERKQQSLSPEIEKLSFTHAVKKPNYAKFIKNVDFFPKSSEYKEEIDFRYHPVDEADEIKSFLGIFDGIF